MEDPASGRPDAPSPLRRRVPAIAVLILSLGITFLLSTLINRQEEHRIRREFEWRAANLERALQNRIDADFAALRSIEGLFLASDRVTPEAFDRFAGQIRPHHPGILFFLWFPNVPETESLPVRRFPAEYIHPRQARETILGFDLASEHALNQALTTSVRTALPSASPITSMAATSGQSDGFFVFVPILKGDPASPNLRRHGDVLGVIAAAFVAKDWFLSTMATLQLEGLRAELIDADEDGRRIVATGADSEHEAGDESSSWESRHLVWMADRNWSLVVKPAAGFISAQKAPGGRLGLAGGVLFSLLLAAYVSNLSGRASRTQRVVDERTGDLLGANLKLENEIRERLRAEEELRRSEQRYALSVAGAKDGLWDWNLKTDDLYMSPRAKAILGFQDSELENRMSAYSSRIHPEDFEDLDRSLRGHLQTGKQFYDTEHRVRHKDGTYRWVYNRGAVLFNSQGKPYRMAGSVTDITERKRIEEERFRAIDEKYRAVVETFPEGLLIFDRDGLIIYCNEAAAAVLGVPASEMTGLPDYSRWDLRDSSGMPVRPEDFPSAWVLATGKPVAGAELSIRRSDGSRVTILLDATPVISPGGAVEAAVVSARDVTERKRAEEALKVFKEALENSTDAIAMATPQGRHYYQNRTFDRLFGDLGHTSPIDAYADRQVGEDIFRTIIPGGQWTGEVKMYAKDRRIADVLLRAYANRDQHGNIMSLVGIHTDITDRKRAEEELAEANRFLDSIIENLPDMIFVKEAENLRFVRFNRAGEELLGYSRDELIGKNDYDFFPKEEADFFTSKDRDVLSSRTYLDIPEEPILTREKGLRYLRTKKIPILGADGRPKYLLGISDDITDRKHSEEELRRVNEQRESILASAGEGICGIDTRGRATFINPAAARLFGCSAQDLTGRSIHDIAHGSGKGVHSAKDCRILRGLAESPERTSSRDRFRRREEGEFPVTYVMTPIHEGGAVAGAVVTFRDETESERMQQTLIDHSRMAALGRMAAGIAHEIRNPLFGISASARLLAANSSWGRKERELADSMLLEINRLNRLLENLLLYARPRRIERAVVAASKLLEELVETHGGVLTPRRLRFEQRHDDRAANVSVDAGQMRQVILNLFLNAVQAAPDGSTILAESRMAGNVWIFSIHNRGIPIPPENRDVIFEPFYSTKDEGTGLGLAVSRKIVEEHGGTIACERSDRDGTTFVVRIPGAAALTGARVPV